jgi:hypothetical protein
MTIYRLNNLSLEIKALTTVSTYLLTIKAPTLNLSGTIFALTLCANQYNTNPIEPIKAIRLILFYISHFSNWCAKQLFLSNPNV